MILIAMGVSGAGKMRIGELLAERLGCTFTGVDAFHSAANKETMPHGVPLTDDDRWPWLQSIRAAIEEKQRTGETVVFICSSLKRSYRGVLCGKEPTCASRLSARHPRGAERAPEDAHRLVLRSLVAAEPARHAGSARRGRGGAGQHRPDARANGRRGAAGEAEAAGGEVLSRP